MKLSIMLLTVCTLHASANLYAQSKRFSLAMNDVPVKEVLRTIEQQSDFRFFYNDDLSDINRHVTVDIRDSNVEDILYKLFDKKRISYRVMENNLIVITPVNLLKQQVSVSGTITDESTGEPLAGVTVQIKGTMSGTISQADGTFSVNVTEGNQILIFSFVGYETQEITVAGRTLIDVVLRESITALEEIVVTGYATERKKDIIGSVAVVQTDELLSTPSGSLTNQLQGRAAGVTISSDGAPGKSGRVRIRGFGSFGDSEPLYIIDGVPGDIDMINPNDIASVQVLKDAASAAVYGARAANGVIIITTKQGSVGATKIALDAYAGFSYVGKNNKPDVLNAQEWGEYYWLAMEGAGRQPGDANWSSPQYGEGTNPVIPEYIYVNDNGVKYGGTALEQLRTGNPALFNNLTDPANYDFVTHQIVKAGDTDWFDEVYDLAPIENYQLSASGGSESGTYLISLNYFNQGSTATEYSYFKRYNLRANSSLKIGDFIRIGENLQFSFSNSRDVSMNDEVWTFHPMIPVYDIEGNPASSAAPGLVTWGSGGRNPVTTPWEERFDGTKGYGFLGNAYLEIDLFRDITLRSSIGMDYNSRRMKNFAPTVYEHYENNTPIADNLTLYNFNSFGWVWTNTATYAKTFNSHTVRLLVGSEAVQDDSETLSGTRFNYDYALQQDENFLVLNSGTGTQQAAGTEDHTSLFSLFGRFDYTYADKYIVNATVRRDGSSKFGENNRYGIFPSAAIGWRISSEQFMQNLTWLTDLKLRASTGVIGNQSGLNRDNQYFTFISDDQQSYALNGQNTSVYTSYTADHIGNPDAKWERTVNTNIGIDATFLSGKLTFTGDYYVRKTKDLLVQNQAPLTGSMAEQPYVNVGSMQNTGIDLNLVNRGNITGDLQYELTLNFSKYKNEVTKVLDNPNGYLLSGNSRTEAGYPIAYFYGYVIDGFFDTQQEVDDYNALVTTTWIPPAVGRWRIKDLNNDNRITVDDRTFIGSPHPDFQVNLSLSLNYRNFDFFTTLFWNQGGDIYNSIRSSIDFNSANFNRSKRMLYDSWTPDNTDAKLPKLDINDNFSSTYATDYFIEDGTFMRLKTLQLGYTLPPAVLNKLGISNLRIYVQGQNLLTFKKFTGMDPDAAFSSNRTNIIDPTVSDRGTDLQMGVAGNATPTPQQVIFGINLSF